jgi:hypothetical protein
MSIVIVCSLSNDTSGHGRTMRLQVQRTDVVTLFGSTNQPTKLRHRHGTYGGRADADLGGSGAAAEVVRRARKLPA